MGTLAMALALVVVVGAPRRAPAHLLPSGPDTLLGLMAAADGMVVARTTAATHLRGSDAGATPLLARETVAGIGPEDGFVLDAEPPILRYAELQDVLVLLARRPAGPDGVRWLSVQPAGAAIVLESPTLPERSRTLLKRLWTVAHPAPTGGAEPAVAVAALIESLSLPEEKLRTLAFRDLAALAADPEHFTPAATARLATFGDRPGDDTRLAPAVRELGGRLQRSGTPAGTTAEGAPR